MYTQLYSRRKFYAMDKRFLGFLAVISLLFVGIVIYNNSNKAAAPDTSSASLTNHVKGESTTGVELIEFGDFQCPGCAQYYPVLKQVMEKYGDQISMQFRHFPLIQIHPNALAASRAAEAAGEQDKFWEMHDLLFENQASWGASSNPLNIFTSYATRLDLDTEKFTEDFRSSTINNRIQADIGEGNRLGVSSTPTFLLNGKKISSPQSSLEAFSRVIDNAIAQKAESSPSPASETPANAEDQPATVTPGEATETPAQ